MISVTLYAGDPGAFIDLVADLAWLTGRRLAEFVLDRHLAPPWPPEFGSGVAVATLIDQAIGVLIGQGYTPARAVREINARAVRLGVDRHESAKAILAEPAGSATESS